MKHKDSPIGFTVDGVLAAAGGPAAVANACGLTVQAVAKWGRRVPERHAQRVAVMAGLPLEIVRPDLVRDGHAMAVQYVKRGRG